MARDAHNDTSFVTPLADVFTETEPNTGQPTRSYDAPRGDTVNDSGPSVLGRDRLTVPEKDTFITEVLYAKQSKLDTSLMFVVVPWDPALQFKIARVNRGSTEASIIIHDDYGLMPVQSTENMMFGSSQCGAGFATLLDYRNYEIDAKSNYRWKAGQAVDAMVRFMQRHMISLYLNHDRVPYDALSKIAWQNQKRPIPDMDPRKFLGIFENEGFNIVRRSRWSRYVKQYREKVMKLYDYNNDIQGGVNNGSRSNSIFITHEIVHEAQEDIEQLYVIWQGDLDPAGSAVTSVASWEYMGAPGSMFIRVEPVRYRGMNNIWLESMVMRNQHTFFPVQTATESYADLDIMVPDFASTARDVTSRYYKLSYGAALKMVMLDYEPTNMNRALKAKNFDKWFDTGVTQEFMAKKADGWKDFGEFVEASQGLSSPRAVKLHAQSKMRARGSEDLWSAVFSAKWDALIARAGAGVSARAALDGWLGTSPTARQTATAYEFRDGLPFRDGTGAKTGEKMLKRINALSCTRADSYLFEICDCLRLLNLPLPFGICVRRTPVLREHMILSIDNYAAYHQEDVVDQSIRLDPKQGGITVNFTQKFKDYIIENRGIVQMEGAYPLEGQHLPCGSKQGYESHGFDKYVQLGQGKGAQTGATNRTILQNKSGHSVHPVFLIEAAHPIDFMSTIGYDDPAFDLICGTDKVFRESKPTERYLSTSDSAAMRLGIANNFRLRLRHFQYFMDVEKKLVKVKPYSWMMETRRVVEKDAPSPKAFRTEEGPTKGRIFIYIRDMPTVPRAFGEAFEGAKSTF